MHDLSSVSAHHSLPIRYCEILRRDAPDSQFEQSRDAFKHAIQRATVPSMKTESLAGSRPATVPLSPYPGSHSQADEQSNIEASTTEYCLGNSSSEYNLYRLQSQLKVDLYNPCSLHCSHQW